jgi:hypothetical protein
MPFLMTDVAAGSNAARTMQQNAYGAQFDQQNIAAEAQQKQLQLQKTAAETQQLQARANLEKLQESMLGLEIQDKEESRKAAAKLMQTIAPDTPLEEQLDKLSVAIAPFDPKGSKELSDASANHALKDANAALKKNEDARQHIGNLDSVVKAIPNDKLEEVLAQLPPADVKSVSDRVGPGWAKMSPLEKKAVIHNLAESTDQKLREQNIAMQIQKQKMHDEMEIRKTELNNQMKVLNRSHALGMEERTWDRMTTQLDKIYHDPEVVQEAKELREKESKARAAATASTRLPFTAYKPAGDDNKYYNEETYTAWQNSVKDLENFRRGQLFREMDIVKSMPDSAKGIRDSRLKLIESQLLNLGPPEDSKPKQPDSSKRSSGMVGGGVTENNTSKSGSTEVGSIEDGYRFKGGDPRDSKNWEKVK